jgi:hypothetical protein
MVAKEDGRNKPPNKQGGSPERVEGISLELRQMLDGIAEESDVEAAMDALLEEGYVTTREEAKRLLLKETQDPKK